MDPKFLRILGGLKMTAPDLKKKVLDLLDNLGVPGAIVSLKSQVYTPFLILYGYSNIETRRPVSKDDAFRIGSVTKTFTGIVLLQLYQEGKIDLDDPVSKYLVGIPNGDNITVREVGNMRSGIFNYTEDPRVISLVVNQPKRYWLPVEPLLVGVSHPLYFPPGTNFYYSNTNSYILGFIIERLTKEKLQAEIRRRIIEPLGLTNTVFENDYILEPPRMEGYMLNGNSDGWKNVTKFNASSLWAAGAISSNLSDMHRYLKDAIGKHSLLDADATRQQRRFESSIVAEPSGLIQKYGFHLAKLGTFLGHEGSTIGYNTYILCEIKTKTTLVIAINTQETLSGEIPGEIVAQFIVSYLNNM
ncbi:Beta-lactamase-related serine hydrolase [uncultured virus]|nr:Beta-lactamase-related serine hydrolase [uncultured virus]